MEEHVIQQRQQQYCFDITAQEQLIVADLMTDGRLNLPNDPR